MAKATVLAVFLVLGIVSPLGLGRGAVKGVEGQQVAPQLRADFYNLSCPSVEIIVRSRMNFHFQQDPSIAAHILRLQFHDCAATGCDASLLLTGSNSEQSAAPNLSVKGYEVLEDIKAQLEANCRGVVSCSDIIAMATRDSISLTHGPNFSIPLGRFDGLVSGGTNVNLLSPDATVDSAISFFQTLGLSANDLVVLLGAHTIGAAHCSSFSSRLYNFNNTGQPDPSLQLDPTFLATLQQTCPQTNTNASTLVALDSTTEFIFDNSLYAEMVKHHGVLTLDEELFTSNLTTGTVNQMVLNQTLFFDSFVAAIIKMGQIGVKDNTTGNIRARCSSVLGTSGLAGSPAFAPAPPPLSGADTPFSAPVSAPSPAAVSPAAAGSLVPAAAASPPAASPSAAGSLVIALAPISGA